MDFEKLKEKIIEAKAGYYKEIESKKELAKLINPNKNDIFVENILTTTKIHDLLEQLYQDTPALKRIIKDKIMKIGTYIDIKKPDGTQYMIELEFETWGWVSVSETLDYSQEWSYEMPFGLENQKERDIRRRKLYEPLR